MMTFTPLDEEAYESAQVEIGYCKLFPLILRDFITRRDMEQILIPSNLPVNTTVNTIVAATAPTGPVTGTGIGKGSGATTPVYNGNVPSAGSKILEGEKLAIKEAGGTAIESTLGALSEV